MAESCCSTKSESTPRLKAVFCLILLFSAWGFSTGIPALSKFGSVLEHDFKTMFLPLLAGIVLGGMVDAWIPSSWITSWLAGSRKRSLIYSVGLGFLMSACSHGLVAIAMQLHKKGAARSSVVSFLLASPWANLAMTFLLIGFYKFWGLVIIAAAIVIAFTTGLIFQKFEQNRRLGPVSQTAAGTPVSREQWWKEIKSRTFPAHLRAVWEGTLNLAEMIVPWIALGIFLAAVSSALVPEHWFHQYLGRSFSGLAATLGLASVIEVCSEGMSFLAFELYKQTGALGNAFVFLMAGVATDFTELSLIWKNLGKKSVFLLLAAALPQIVLIGWLLNFVTP